MFEFSTRALSSGCKGPVSVQPLQDANEINVPIDALHCGPRRGVGSWLTSQSWSTPTSVNTERCNCGYAACTAKLPLSTVKDDYLK